VALFWHVTCADHGQTLIVDGGQLLSLSGTSGPPACGVMREIAALHGLKKLQDVRRCWGLSPAKGPTPQAAACRLSDVRPACADVAREEPAAPRITGS
jgi:hypothetical protein